MPIVALSSLLTGRTRLRDEHVHILKVDCDGCADYAPEGLEIGRMVGPAPWASEDAKAFIEEALALYAPAGEG